MRGQVQVTAILALASFAGAVIAPTIYIGDIKTDVSGQGIEIGHLKAATTELQAAFGNHLTDEAVQNKSLQRVENYIEFGILPRLQLDKEKILKEANMASTT